MKETKNTEKKKVDNVFDAAGHRIARNPETTHRMPSKVSPHPPEGFRIGFVFPVELVAKLRVYIRGRVVPTDVYRGRPARKPTRPMTVGDMFREYATVLTKNVVLDAESQKWVDDTIKAQTERYEREMAMVAAGVNRIPKEQQLKRGVGSESYKAKKAKAAKGK